MNILLPCTAQKDSFWGTKRGKNTFASHINMIKNIHFADTITMIFHDRKLAVDIDNTHTKVMPLSSVTGYDPKYLPEGSICALSCYEQVPEDGIMMLNPYALSLTVDHISSTYDVYTRKKKNCVASVSGFNDHPCQLFDFLKIENCGTLIFPETPQPKHICTPPQHEKKSTGICINGEGYQDIHVDKTNKGWRILLPTCIFGEIVENFILRYIGFNKTSLLESTAGEILVDFTSENVVIEVTPCSGLTWTASSFVHGGAADKKERFWHKYLPWKIESNGSKDPVCINTQKSVIVNGRQDYPKAYTLDGCIAILNYEAAKMLSNTPPETQKIQLNNWEFIKLSENPMQTVTNFFDYLIYTSKHNRIS